jgi:hypothetical protein
LQGKVVVVTEDKHCTVLGIQTHERISDHSAHVVSVVVVALFGAVTVEPEGQHTVSCAAEAAAALVHHDR